MLLAGFTTLVFLLASCQSNTPASSASASLEAVIDSIALEPIQDGQAAGMTVAVSRNGELIYLKGYGLVDLEWSVPTPEDATYEIGSVTKQFTAVAALQLVENGKLSLQDELSKYFPDFNFRGYQLTVGQLFDHTSGIKGYTEIPAFWELSLHEYPRDTLLAIVEKEGFDFEPGTAQIYNNTAYFMLGLIIEQVSDTTYAAYLEENVFKPAGLTNTYYCDERKVVEHHAHGYDMGPEGELMLKGYLDHTWPYAAGSLCSTAADLVKWNQALHGGKVLSPEMYRLMITPGTLNDGTPLRYAKGLTNYLEDGHRLIGHGGGINGFLSDSRYYPDEELVIVTLINTAGPVNPASISRKIARRILGVEKEQLPVFEGDLDAYAGSYRGRVRGRDLTVEIRPAGSVLTFQAEGSSKPDTLQYLGDHTWREILEMPNSELFEFVADDSGRVVELRIKQPAGYYLLSRKE